MKSGIGRVQIITDTIEVEAFPQDLPKEFVIDVSKLENLHDTVHVKDLAISDTVVILSEADDTIVTVVEFVEEVEEEEVVEEETDDAADEDDAEKKEEEEKK